MSGALLLLYALWFVPARGDDNKPKQILLRLEDVGPGGQYEGAEQLGKLRAVLDMLKDRNVRYQIALIPRWIHIAKDGTRYDVSIDQTDDPYVRSFVSLMQEASRSGAIIGMHGYTHQVGEAYRKDGHQESGIGNEFYMPDVEASMTTRYASQRIIEGAEKFARAGLFPYFWEAPHYWTLPEQDEVFRNYFGLHFQANMKENRYAVQPQYSTERNVGYGASSLGAVYVPTPLSYIPYNRDADIITSQLDESDKLPAFFFHPFLEFRHLLPVTDESGAPVIRDGLPLYRYPAGGKSPLQKLLPRLDEKGYRFISLTDLIPFVPAHSVKIGAGRAETVKAGDVTGDGQADIVFWDRAQGRIAVAEGRFRGLRNEAAPNPDVWCHLSYAEGDAWTLFDDNGDGKADLWIMRTNGTLETYRAGRSAFALVRSWKTGAHGWREMAALRSGQGWAIVGESMDGSQLESFMLAGEELVPLAKRPWNRRFPGKLMAADLDGDGNDALLIPFPRSSRWIELVPDPGSRKWRRNVLQLTLPTDEEGRVRTGDFNGDGKEDLLFWKPETGTFVVYRQTGPLQFELLSRMGPWGRSADELLVCDMNGDGRKDVAEMAGDGPYLDTAMSFQSRGAIPGKGP